MYQEQIKKFLNKLVGKMNIIILCAGSGRRIDIDKPKCLLKSIKL